jgi:hypothetical protein
MELSGRRSRVNGRAYGGATRYPRQRLLARDRPAVHTNHYISDKFEAVADRAGESVQRLEETAATLGGVSDRELMERARFLVQSPGFVPPSADRSVVTAFVMLADIELGSVETAPGGGGRGPWVCVTLP